MRWQRCLVVVVVLGMILAVILEPIAPADSVTQNVKGKAGAKDKQDKQPSKKDDKSGGKGGGKGAGKGGGKKGSAVPATLEQLYADMKAPADFAVDIFARHPDINYPTCICPTPDGRLFVGCDGNSAQGKAPNRGKVVLVQDKDGDGKAETFTLFCKVDHPRGLLYFNGTLYVNHPGDFSAFYDDDGDGKADRSVLLVKDIAARNAYTKRGADHSTNNITMGIDGWIYFAVGDQGMDDASAPRDGAKLQMRGGIARIRPDGTGLEQVTWGQRNIYGVAIDPYMNLFSRDNTNDGGGWNVRLNHNIPTAQYGYPSLYVNFADEILSPLIDYGGGGPTGATFLDEPLLPEPYHNTLFTVDYGKNAIYRHVIEPEGATFKKGTKQVEFLRCTNPINMEFDGIGHLYISSFRGAGFNYTTENTGYIARLTHKSIKPNVYPDLTKFSDGELVRTLTGPSAHLRLHAQRELLRRADTAEMAAALEKAAATDGALSGRVAALFTLKLLFGERSHPALVRLAADAKVREFALKALADDKTKLAGVPTELFVNALKDPDGRVRLQAVLGLGRLGKKELAEALIPLLADPEPTIAHAAYRNLWILGAHEACLKALSPSSSPQVILGSTFALQLMHQPVVVDGLIKKLQEESDARVKQAAIRALARLYFHEKPWDGTWWGTRPSTVGPYFQTVKWSESDRIADVFTKAAKQADSVTLAALLTEANRSRVPLPGKSDLTFRLAQTETRFRSQAVDLMARESNFTPEAIALLQKIVLEGTDTLDLRSRSLRGLGVGAFTLKKLDPLLDVMAELGFDNLPGPLAAVRDEIIRDARQAEHVDFYAKVAQGGDTVRRRFAYSVLVQINGNFQLPAEPRNKSGQAIESAWTSAATTVSLLQSIGDMQAEEYALQIKTFLKDVRAEVQKAAALAAKAIDLESLERPKGPTISGMKYEDLVASKEPGDAKRGARLFLKQGCVLCHTIAAGETPKGPHLADIGNKLKREELLEAILKPSAKLAQGYESWLFTLLDGRSVTGFIARDAGDEIEIRNVGGISTLVPKTQIDERVRLETSIMPEGLANTLTTQDLSSLIAYLESLKTKE